MDIRKIVLGIVLFAIFWAFHVSSSSFGRSQWLVGSILFAGLLIAAGKATFPKPPADVKYLWEFAAAFVIVLSAIASFFLDSLSAVIPSGGNAAITPFIVSVWLAVAAAGVLLTGIRTKMVAAQVAGIVWLVAALQITSYAPLAPNAYLYMGILTGVSIFLMGALESKKRKLF